MDCKPKPGQYNIRYQSSRDGQDVTIDVLDANCNSIQQIKLHQCANGAQEPTRDLQLNAPGVASPVTISWRGWNSMSGVLVQSNGKTYDKNCGNEFDQTACLPFVKGKKKGS